MSAAQPEPPKVLVVEDNEGVRASLSRLLSLDGFRIIEADSAERAAGLLGTTTVSAMILDVNLAGTKSGLELLKDLHESPATAKTPTIVLTGACLTDAQQAALHARGGVLFQKPYDANELLGFLKQITCRDQPH